MYIVTTSSSSLHSFPSISLLFCPPLVEKSQNLIQLTFFLSLLTLSAAEDREGNILDSKLVSIRGRHLRARVVHEPLDASYSIDIIEEGSASEQCELLSANIILIRRKEEKKRKNKKTRKKKDLEYPNRGEFQRRQYDINRKSSIKI